MKHGMDNEIESKLKCLRKGDAVTVEKCLSELAETMRDLRAMLELIHSKGAYVLVEQTGQRSDTPDGVEMVFEAATKLKKGAPAPIARANGLKGGRHKIDREMSIKDAKLHWRSRDYETNAEALRHMPGWTKAAAYKYLGKSGREVGRPKPGDD